MMTDEQMMALAQTYQTPMHIFDMAIIWCGFPLPAFPDNLFRVLISGLARMPLT